MEEKKNMTPENNEEQVPAKTKRSVKEKWKNPQTKFERGFKKGVKTVGIFAAGAVTAVLLGRGKNKQSGETNDYIDDAVDADFVPVPACDDSDS